VSHLGVVLEQLISNIQRLGTVYVNNKVKAFTAHIGGPRPTDSDGGFTFDCPNRAPGERVRLGVIKEGYVVVNWVQLDLALPKDPNAIHCRSSSGK
jgi:hypothetical protein